MGDPAESLGLPWLPEPAPDFALQVRTLRAAFDSAAFRRLATARLNLQQLNSLARALPRQFEDLPTDRLHLRVLANSTVDLLLPALAATAPRHGIWLATSTSAFGTHVQEALDPSSETHRLRPDAVLLALDHRAFDLSPCPGDERLAQQRVDAAIAHLWALAAAVQKANNGLVIVQTLPAVSGALFGSMDGRLPGTTRWLIEAFNRQLGAKPLPGCLILDAAALAGTIGLDRWHDPSLWSLGKIAFGQAAVPLYADHVCRLLMAARGKARKCLVLDLDNTVWGGVIGDDGLAGIVLGQGSAAGEAHLAVQALALSLRARGIVLAVSSKNEDAIARAPFREHPEMLLKEEHIAAFQANWQDKATNLRAIAKMLNIGVDSLVLLDDNPSERHQVRTALPEVGVPELPVQPEYFAPTLMAAGYFEAVAFTADDRERASQYQANAARSALLESGHDLRSHLASLDMVATISAFDEVGRGRITQLINKTNQFNLTTRRRSEAEVAVLERETEAQTLQVRLKDRFGDNGMIGVVICMPTGGGWDIDTWLMSCRVLNRGVEKATLNLLVALARRRGIAVITARYLPTEKNVLVRDHYAALGFVADEARDESGGVGAGTAWVLDVGRYEDFATQIRVETDLLAP